MNILKWIRRNAIRPVTRRADAQAPDTLGECRVQFRAIDHPGGMDAGNAHLRAVLPVIEHLEKDFALRKYLLSEFKEQIARVDTTDTFLTAWFMRVPALSQSARSFSIRSKLCPIAWGVLLSFSWMFLRLPLTTPFR